MLLRLTTDPQDAVVDVVNENDEIIGSALRSEVHDDKSLIHRSIAVLVFYNNQLYIQRRSATKDTYAGYWTCSCSGHVDKGETYERAATRELREELGLQVEGSLLFLQKNIIAYPSETEYVAFFRYDTSTKIKPNITEISEGRLFVVNNIFINRDLRRLNVTPCLEYICNRIINDK